MKDTKDTRWGIYTGFKVYLVRTILYAFQDCYLRNFKYRCNHYGIHDDMDNEDDESEISGCKKEHKHDFITKSAYVAGWSIIWSVYFLSYCYFYLIVKNFAIRPMGKQLFVYGVTSISDISEASPSKEDDYEKEEDY